MKKVKCCFAIHSVRVVKSSEELGRKNVNIVEISKSSEAADRDIVINHYAMGPHSMGKINGVHAILSRFCDKCERHQCIRCCINHRCKRCQNRSCRRCAYICDGCRDWVCEDCSYFCNACEAVCCENCFAHNAGVCGECNDEAWDNDSDDTWDNDSD